jgi:hypothetical protein
MSIFSNIPLERLAAVFMRHDPKAMAFKIAVIEANVLMRDFHKAEPGTYERALAWQSAGTAVRRAERIYLEAANHAGESKEELALPPEEGLPASATPARAGTPATGTAASAVRTERRECVSFMFRPPI